MSSIGQFAASLDCSTVLSSWRHDPHCDHQATASMARASRLRVLFYPVWGWLLPDDTVLDAEPSGVRISVAGVLDRKRRAIAMHRTQTGLITDDPNGFSLPQSLLDACLTPFEVFLEEPA